MGAKKKAYLDDAFSTYIYRGTGGSNTINNGINFSGDGGLLWLKNRGTANTQHILTDTVRGVDKVLYSDASNGETDTTLNQSFNNNGWTMSNGYGDINSNNGDYASWSFKKTKGFFDIVTYTGDGSSSGRQIAHNLGSVPGCIMVKCTSATNNWAVYHRGADLRIPENYGLNLNNTNARVDNEYYWHDTKPTSTHFTVRDNANVNANGETYVAYIFAGGENTATTARSINFNGSSDYLEIADHADFDVGTDWTAECWFICEGLNSNGWDAIFGQWDSGYLVEYVGTELRFYNANTSYKTLGTTTGTAPLNQWNHVAISKQGSTTRIFLNGTQVVTDFDMGTTSSGNPFRIGGNMGGGAGGYFNGQISNVRIVKGTAVYTSSFRPPTEPLTNITNTVLLCCNGSSVTGSTVTPGTITTPGSSAPNAYTNTPFDDPAAFLFGDAKEGVIKCGRYIGDGNDSQSDGNLDSQEINLGWEPQYVLIKRVNSTESWILYDSMRGIASKDGAIDKKFELYNSDAEGSVNHIELTSTGFTFSTGNQQVNALNSTYIYICIRRPDGYVGKPANAGTDVFAMDAGNSSTTQAFTSGFPVDFALSKKTSSTSHWETVSRLTGDHYLLANLNNIQSDFNLLTFDDNTGWNTHDAYDSVWQSFMWKRHSGFDTVTYTGNGSAGHQIPHSLNKIPEMIWVKRRSPAAIWRVYHKSLNGGSSPEGWNLSINNTNGEENDTTVWTDAPTSTHFNVGTSGGSNGNNNTFLAMLFASVDGISKVGQYSGSSSAVTLDLGFQPRFIIIRRYNTGGTGWFVFDTVRGINTGNDPYLELDEDAAQVNTQDWVDLTSTGITINHGMSGGHAINDSGDSYIYYAHA